MLINHGWTLIRAAWTSVSNYAASAILGSLSVKRKKQNQTKTNKKTTQNLSSVILCYLNRFWEIIITSFFLKYIIVVSLFFFFFFFFLSYLIIIFLMQNSNMKNMRKHVFWRSPSSVYAIVLHVRTNMESIPRVP